MNAIQICCSQLLFFGLQILASDYNIPVHGSDCISHQYLSVPTTSPTAFTIVYRPLRLSSKPPESRPPSPALPVHPTQPATPAMASLDTAPLPTVTRISLIVEHWTISPRAGHRWVGHAHRRFARGALVVAGDCCRACSVTVSDYWAHEKGRERRVGRGLCGRRGMAGGLKVRRAVSTGDEEAVMTWSV